MSDAPIGIFQLTHEAELEFPHIFEPRQYKGRGEPKYDAMLVFDNDHPDMADLKALCGRVAKAAFPGVPFSEIRFPLKSGEKVIEEATAKAKAEGKKPYDNSHLAGKVVVTARSLYAPRLATNEPNRGLVDVLNEDRNGPVAKAAFFRGVHVLAELNFVGHTVDERHYVTAYLNMLASLKTGQRRGGGKSAAETFAGYVGRISTENPTAGMEDEIPF